MTNTIIICLLAVAIILQICTMISNHNVKSIFDYDIFDDEEEIDIVYHADIDKLENVEIGNCIDLRAAEDVKLSIGESKLISLGVSMKLPVGYHAELIPRSSTFKNFGIVQSNSVGLIDSTYCGTNDVWKFPAYAYRDTEIHKNDRICQFKIVENQPKIKFNEVDSLDSVDRGGFGSTGIK